MTEDRKILRAGLIRFGRIDREIQNFKLAATGTDSKSRRAEYQKKAERLEHIKGEIQGAILNLSGVESEIITLHYINQKSWAYIQIECNYSLASLNRIAGRAMNRLQKDLKKSKLAWDFCRESF